MAESAQNIDVKVKAVLADRFGKKFYSGHSTAEYTSTHLGGTTEALVIADTVEELIDAAKIASKYQAAFAVIGGGTGVLISDVGYPGLIIVNRTDRLLFDGQKSQVVVDSGVTTDRLINSAAARGLGGLEYLAAIPGSIGGAVATNAGYEGKNIVTAVKELILYVPGGDEGQVVAVSGNEITTGAYQRMFPDSVIHSPIILSVRLQFSQTDQPEILRRLINFRRRRQKLLSGSRLTQVFVQSLKTAGLDRTTLNNFKKLGAAVEVESEAIIRLKDRLNSQTLRKIILQIKESAAQAEAQLDERIQFLGYWPDEDQENITTDSQDT